jgi:hypothetical protein
MTQRELEPIYDDTFTRSSRHKQPKRHHYFGWVLIGVFVLALIGFFGWHSHRQSALQNYPVRGVSVSQDDGYIDFHQLQSAKLKFVYLKGTSGASYLDDRFNDGTNEQLARKCRLVCTKNLVLLRVLKNSTSISYNKLVPTRVTYRLPFTSPIMDNLHRKLPMHEHKGKN